MASRVELRLAALILLMISDLDFMFSYLFIAVLHETWVSTQNYVYVALLIVVILGQVVYIVGVVHFGPRQKELIAAQVREFMVSNPDKCRTEKWKPGKGSGYEAVPVTDRDKATTRPEELQVTLDMPVSPCDNRTQKVVRIRDLDLDDPQARQAFQAGLGMWGLQDIWDGVEHKNSQNCLKASHGVPLWRLAQYGFQAMPFPKDLGGILNANALYTFACGFVQLVGGLVLLIQTWETTELSEKVTVLVPWTVSFISAVLSIVNVVKDFSGMLIQMENEEDLQKKIMVKAEKESREAKERLDQAHKTKLKQIEHDCEKKTEMSDEVLAEVHAKKLNMLSDETDRFVLEMDRIENDGVMILEMELKSYRMKLKRVRDLLAGKVILQQEDDQARTAQLERANDRIKVRAELQRTLDEHRNSALMEMTQKIADKEMKGSDMAAEVARIEKEYAEMKAALPAQ